MKRLLAWHRRRRAERAAWQASFQRVAALSRRDAP